MPSPLRRVARALLIAGVATSLLLPLGATASAASRPAARRSSHRLTIASARRHLMALVAQRSGAEPAALGRPSRVFYTTALFLVRSHDADFPEWIAGVARLGRETYLVVETMHDLSNGFTDDAWVQEIPAADIAVDTRLRHMVVHTGTDLGSFGSVDLSFTPVHRGRHVIRCDSTHRVLGAERRAAGTMSGDFTFHTQMTGFPATLHATAPHAVLDQIAFNGRRCPERHGFHHIGCYQQQTFRVSDGAGATLTTDPRYGELLVTATTVVGDMHIVRDAFIFPDFGFSGHPKNPVSIAGRTLTIDGDEAGDPFAGAVTLARSGPSVVHRSRHCRRSVSSFTWRDGTLSANLPGGVVTFTGDDLEARFLRRGSLR